MAGLGAIRSRHLILLEPPDRPRTRGDCRDGIRPCPYALCRYHLANDDDGRHRPRINAGMMAAIEHALEHDDTPTFPTCALDVAEGGESTVYEIAAAMGIWHSNVDPALESGLAKARESAERLGIDPKVFLR